MKNKKLRPSLSHGDALLYIRALGEEIEHLKKAAEEEFQKGTAIKFNKRWFQEQMVKQDVEIAGLRDLVFRLKEENAKLRFGWEDFIQMVVRKKENLVVFIEVQREYTAGLLERANLAEKKYQLAVEIGAKIRDMWADYEDWLPLELGPPGITSAQFIEKQVSQRLKGAGKSES